LSIGNAFRFPSLSELFFHGSTARGKIIGNSSLKPERSINHEYTFKWKHQESIFKLTSFKNKINHYIAKRLQSLSIHGDKTFHFMNDYQGNIHGTEWEYQHSFGNEWLLNIVGTWMRSEGYTLKGHKKIALMDIPADRVSMVVHYQAIAWKAHIKLQHRAHQQNVAEGELAIPAVNLFSAGIRYAITPQWQLTLTLGNLLNRSYFNSSDNLATLMPGRHFGIQITWKE
jgi:iron complex outermembrane receptor protein